MNNSVIEVSEENEHLGMVVTGFREEERNVEENLSSGRKSLFCLLGPAFSQKCHLNPALQVHLSHREIWALLVGNQAISLSATHYFPQKIAPLFSPFQLP